MADHFSSGPTARFRSVSAELEAIFGTPAGAGPVGGGRSAVRILTPRTGPAKIRTLRAVHGLALVAVLAAGILAAALWPSRSGPPSVPVAIAAVQPQRAPVVMTLAAKAVPETAMTVAEAAPKAGPARAAAAPRRKVSPPARTRRVSTQSGPSVKRSALARRDPCAALGGLDRSRCLYPVVLAADQRLRSAYADAAREGASRSTLASYRKDWLRLRRRANSEPDRVIEGYLAMARELGSLAAGPDPRGRS